MSKGTSLTPQEQRGRDLFVAGATERQVAAELGIGNGSAHRLKKRLFEADVAPEAPVLFAPDQPRLVRSKAPVREISGSRQCSKGGEVYPAHLVRAMFRPRENGALRSACKRCEQTKRDEAKGENRWLVKASDTLANHVASLKRSKQELIEVFGWDTARMARDAEFLYGGDCWHCNKPYNGMANGMRDITLDIIDRTREPYYRTNVRWVCSTCNGSKGVKSPEEYELELQGQQIWEKRSGIVQGALPVDVRDEVLF